MKFPLDFGTNVQVRYSRVKQFLDDVPKFSAEEAVAIVDSTLMERADKRFTVSLEVGDVHNFDGCLVHGSYQNKSEERYRRAFVSHYFAKGSITAKIG